MLDAHTVNDTAALMNANAAAPEAGVLNRRAAIGATLGVGYAAAAAPVMAQTAIKTNSDGLTTGEVLITVAGHSMPVFRAAPAGQTNLPVVIVISEIFGVHEYIADVARRFAKAGYLALAPELFGRQGDASSYAEVGKLMSEVVSKVPDAQVVTDLDALVAYAGANGGNTDKLGVTGFCWGGRQTWLYTAANPKVKAGVAWYGRLVGAANPLQPKHPVDLAGSLNGPVLGLYGEADTGIPLDTVEKMKEALKVGSAAAKKSEFVVYAKSPHAFHADYRPSYRADDAADGFKRCLAWFKANGVA